jgi:hypothetical protein
MAGSTRGCAEGFKYSWGEVAWEKILSIYPIFLDGARRGVFPVEGDLSKYPDQAIEICPEIYRSLRCSVLPRDLIVFALVNKIEMPLELQMAIGVSQSGALLPGIQVMISKDERKRGGKCIVSGFRFPPDFKVEIEALAPRERAKILVQSAVRALVSLKLLMPMQYKKEIEKTILEIPFIGPIVSEFNGAHTIRDWITEILAKKPKMGRPFLNSPAPIRFNPVALLLDQTLPLYIRHGTEMEKYLARLKAAVLGISYVFAWKTDIPVEQIFKSILIQRLLRPVCIGNPGLKPELKNTWVRKWIHEAVRAVRNK